MRKLLLFMALTLVLTACNENGTIDGDSIDSAGEKLQNTVENTADSFGTKVERWADSLHNDKDTIIY